MATSSEPTNFLLIGNPGTGKSTILNGLIGKAVFKSGVSYGKGLTFQFDKHKEGVHTYMDTPGLADIDLRKQAAAAITEALKQDGYYKIFFVVVLVNGRVKAEDVTTMKLVLDAAPITDYGIIINQVPRKQYKDLMENPSGEEPSPYERVCACLTPAMSSGKASLRVFFLQRDDELEDATDVVKDLPAELPLFISTTPGMMIASSKVEHVSDQSFEELQAEMETTINNLREQNASLEKALAEQSLQLDSLRTQLQEQRVQMEAALAKAQKDAADALQRAQDEFESKRKQMQEDFNQKLAAEKDAQKKLLDKQKADNDREMSKLNEKMTETTNSHKKAMSNLESQLKDARNRIGFADVLGAATLVGIPNLYWKANKQY